MHFPTERGGTEYPRETPSDVMCPIRYSHSPVKPHTVNPRHDEALGTITSLRYKPYFVKSEDDSFSPHCWWDFEETSNKAKTRTKLFLCLLYAIPSRPCVTAYRTVDVAPQGHCACARRRLASRVHPRWPYGATVTVRQRGKLKLSSLVDFFAFLFRYQSVALIRTFHVGNT